jgi:hypothetical protein
MQAADGLRFEAVVRPDYVTDYNRHNRAEPASTWVVSVLVGSFAAPKVVGTRQGIEEEEIAENVRNQSSCAREAPSARILTHF